MSDDGEFSYPDYASKYALPDVDDEPLAIRLIQIQPRIGDDHPTASKIVLRMRVPVFSQDYQLWKNWI
ncbi:hypothetical protein HYQ45_018806 [Verticillium longisporum]|uniref:Uncharacterized protein n=1 Tax=Verticillium longisporum TaxID=100787 RepID=A0A8I3A1A2_VERLO|nr:hypothetical protein HYQ45_018806 [Verticillium longisporum]